MLTLLILAHGFKKELTVFMSRQYFIVILIDLVMNVLDILWFIFVGRNLVF